MKKLNWPVIILDLIYIALGILFIIHPEGVESALCVILAASVAVFGLLNILGFFIMPPDKDGRREGNGFTIGILLIALAIFIFVKQDLVISLVPFLFGVMVMARGLVNLQGIFFIRHLGLRVTFPVIASLLSIALGLFVMLFPFQTMSFLFIMIGVGMVVAGISGIIEEVSIWHTSRKHAHEEERIRDMQGARTVDVYEAEEEEDAAEAVAEAVPDENDAKAGDETGAKAGEEDERR